METEKSLGEKIRIYRKLKNMTQKVLAEKAELDRTEINYIEVGRTIPRIKTLQKIAQALEVDVRELLEAKESQEELIKEHPSIQNYFGFYSARFIHIPILGKVHAGNPNEIPEDLIIGGVDLPISIAGGADYALKVTGMSMQEVGIEENDIVLVRIQQYATSGQIVIARVDRERYIIQRFRQRDGRIWLESANSFYAPITNNLEVVGIIKGLVKKFT